MNCVMAAVAVAIGYWASLGSVVFSVPLAFAMVSVFLICGAGQAVNDYFDRAIDAKIRPSKPIPSGKVKASTVHYYALALFLVGIVLGYFVNETAFSIALVYSTALYAYSAVLQRWKYVGNALVALGTALTLLYGASLSGSYALVLLFALAVFFANLAREVTKDLEDLRADMGFKKTLPMLLGEKNAKTAVLFYFFLAIFAAFLPYSMQFIETIPYLALATMASLLFAYAGVRCFRGQFKQSQTMAKAGMIIGLVAFLSAAF